MNFHVMLQCGLKMSNLRVIIVMFILFTVFGTIVQAQNITNNETYDPDDSWYDTHWGGDTGNTTYEDAPIVEEEPVEEEPVNYCGGVMMFDGIVFGIAIPLYIHKRRNKYEIKK